VALRIGIGGLWHETNTFAPGRTELADFEALVLADGPREIRDSLEGTATEVGGALGACAELGLEALPFSYAGAVPGPLVSEAAWAALRERFVAHLEAALPLEALVVALHGALVVEGKDDPESELLATVRETVGSIPIAVTLDLHANPGERLVDEVDIVLGYETYPHVDAAERGAEAVRLLADVVNGDLAPLVAGRRLPLLTCPLAQATAAEPMASLLADARRLCARPGLVAVSLVPGFPYADVDRLGFSVLATGEGRAPDEAAEELAGLVWARRDAFRPELVPVDDAVDRALRASGPAVLADVGDNVGGGAPGNATVLLAALLEAGATGVVAVLHDAAAASEAARAGEGAQVEIRPGDPPLTLTGRVRRASETRYRRTGSYMTGQEVDLGLCAVVEATGADILLTSRRAMPFDADHLRVVGIEPAERHVLIVKSALAWQAAFGDIGAEALFVDTGGVTTCRLDTLPYTRVPRPIAPLDPL
jgi:microcystin degradation protein MlrC